jgi:hypothetical protein
MSAAWAARRVGDVLNALLNPPSDSILNLRYSLVEIRSARTAKEQQHFAKLFQLIGRQWWFGGIVSHRLDNTIFPQQPRSAFRSPLVALVIGSTHDNCTDLCTSQCNSRSELSMNIGVNCATVRGKHRNFSSRRATI